MNGLLLRVAQILGASTVGLRNVLFAHLHVLVATAEFKLNAVVAGFRAFANGVAKDAVEE